MQGGEGNRVGQCDLLRNPQGTWGFSKEQSPENQLLPQPAGRSGKPHNLGVRATLRLPEQQTPTPTSRGSLGVPWVMLDGWQWSHQHHSSVKAGGQGRKDQSRALLV